MLVSIFPHRSTTIDDVIVEAVAEGRRLKVSVTYPGTEGRAVSVQFSVPEDVVIKTSHVGDAHDIALCSPKKGDPYVQLTVYGGYNYANPIVAEQIFEKILAEIRKAVAPDSYLSELGEKILRELKSGRTDEKLAEEIKKFLSWVNAK